MTLIRLAMAVARWRGGGTISYSTPSHLYRILYSSSNGSKWMSEAWSRMAISRTMLMSLRTGAELAISVEVVEVDAGLAGLSASSSSMPGSASMLRR